MLKQHVIFDKPDSNATLFPLNNMNEQSGGPGGGPVENPGFIRMLLQNSLQNFACDCSLLPMQLKYKDISFQ